MSVVGSYLVENRLSMPELEANVPRPRARTLGGEGGGGGPTMEAKGSESDEWEPEGEWARFGGPAEGLGFGSLPLLPLVCFLERPTISDEDEAEPDLRR